LNSIATNPHQVLGVPATATADEVRSAYLNLVRLHPPEADGDKFRQINTAYQMLNDPLVQAAAYLKPSEPPDLRTIIAAAEKSICRIPKLALLALGDTE
jgi:preprotein translocase subunit Sec63